MSKPRTFSNPEEARKYLRSLGQQFGGGRARWIGKILETWADNIPANSRSEQPKPLLQKRWKRASGRIAGGEPVTRSYQDPVIQRGDSSLRIFEVLLVLAAIGVAIYLFG